jgi:hypothetical protein
MRGTSLIFGGFPNEVNIFKDLYQDSFENESSTGFLAYLFLFALATIASFFHQFKRYMKSENGETEITYLDK